MPQAWGVEYLGVRLLAMYWSMIFSVMSVPPLDCMNVVGRLR